MAHKDKTVFVTVGTTRFPKLTSFISENEEFVRLLVEFGFDRLIVQHGDVAHFRKPIGLKQCIAFNYSSSIRDFMDEADLIISHGGAGSVLEALESKCEKVLVVINEDLMDNHQWELAEKAQCLNLLLSTVCSNVNESIVEVMGRTFDRFQPPDNSQIVQYIRNIFNL